jgi:lysophospholipase L1-like esterase
MNIIIRQTVDGELVVPNFPTGREVIVQTDADLLLEFWNPADEAFGEALAVSAPQAVVICPSAKVRITTATTADVNVVLSTALNADAVKTVAQALTEEEKAVARANIGITRESVMPGLRAWALRPITSLDLGVVSDSTARTDGGWVRKLAGLIADANPALTIDYRKWTDAYTTIVRERIQTGSGGERYIQQNSASDVTVNYPASSIPAITTSLDLRCKVGLSDWTIARRLITAGWATTSWFAFRINAGGALYFQWASTLGTLNGYATSSVGTGFSANDVKWVRVVLDTAANNVKFYTSTDGETWVQLGTTISAVGEAIAASCGDVIYLGSNGNIGGVTDGTTAKWYEAHIRNGVTGQTLAPTMPDAWAVNYGDRIAISGSPVLSIYNCSWDGASVTEWTEARLKKMLPYDLAAIILALGHNDINYIAKNYTAAKANLDMAVSRVRAVTPNASIVVSTQNPLGTLDTEAEHASRYQYQPGYLANLMQAAKAGGMPVMDIFSMMMELGFDNTWMPADDAFHPTSSTYDTWAQLVYDAIFTRSAY